jgi:2-methylcitrate dehydratase PrpD
LSSTSSLAFAAAAPILIGDPISDKITAELLEDSKTQELMAKVRVEIDPEVDNAFPEHWGARVEVITTDGNQYQMRILDPWGERENPISKLEEDDRFRRLTKPELGDETTERLLQLINNLEELPRVTDLTTLLFK